MCLPKSGHSHAAKGQFQPRLPGTPVLDNPKKESEQYSPQKIQLLRVVNSLCGNVIMRCPQRGGEAFFARFCQLKSNEKWLLFYYSVNISFNAKAR
jgi:hypothetical protein